MSTQVSTPPKVVVVHRDKYVSIPSDEFRAPWLIVLHGMAMIMAGLRKWLRLTDTCEHCGK